MAERDAESQAAKADQGLAQALARRSARAGYDVLFVGLEADGLQVRFAILGDK